MSAHRTERLLNLVICLLATRHWLTKEQIRRAVPQYAQCETTEAFDRMFERDKEDLRELGIPLVSGSADAWFEDEQGYRVDRDAYALPEIELTPGELAVLGLASRVWQQASLAGPAARAMVKLQALGVETDGESLVGVEPRVRTAEPAFEPVYAATRDRAPISFRYRKPRGEAAVRHVQPWAVTSRGTAWYLVGHDVDRGAPRVFRLSRVEGAVRRTGPAGSYTVPADADLAQIAHGSQDRPDERVAVLRVRPGRGAALRLQALDVLPAEPPSDGSPGATAPGWDRVRLRIDDQRMRAEEIAGYGPDVVVEEPPDLRDAVIGLLKGALAAAWAPSPAGSAR
jgi:proteasome accessory factor B